MGSLSQYEVVTYTPPGDPSSCKGCIMHFPRHPPSNIPTIKHNNKCHGHTVHLSDSNVDAFTACCDPLLNESIYVLRHKLTGQILTRDDIPDRDKPDEVPLHINPCPR